MNRLQRRQQARAERKVGAQDENVPVNIVYGHTDEYLVMGFSRPTPSLTLNAQQVDDMIAALQGVKKALVEHQAKLREAANG